MKLGFTTPSNTKDSHVYDWVEGLSRCRLKFSFLLVYKRYIRSLLTSFNITPLSMYAKLFHFWSRNRFSFKGLFIHLFMSRKVPLFRTIIPKLWQRKQILSSRRARHLDKKNPRRSALSLNTLRGTRNQTVSFTRAISKRRKRFLLVKMLLFTICTSNMSSMCNTEKKLYFYRGLSESKSLLCIIATLK